MKLVLGSAGTTDKIAAIQFGSITEPQITLEIKVMDTGIGIKPEDMEKLFKDFVRLDVRKNRNVEGTGLGLALTYRLVELMGGHIDVDSTYGKGSVFAVYLPQRIMNATPIGDFKQQHEQRLAERQKYHEKFIAPEAKVLVVDDNRMNRFVVKNLLKSTQVQVTLLESGAACIEVLRKEHFDIVLLDHMMPEMDGIETLQQLRRERLVEDTPIIALTANAIVGSREKYIAAGFTDYLSKPIAGTKLEEMLSQYLPPDKLRLPNIKSVAASVPLESGQPGTAESMPEAAEDDAAIDTKLGLEFSADDEEIYQEILQLFAKGCREEKDKIQKALVEEHWKNYTTGVHALKSTSLNIGARTLSEQAKALEGAGKKLDIAYIRQHHAEVMALYDRVAAASQKLAETMKQDTKEES